MTERSPITARPAAARDLDAIVALTRDRRHRLAAWEPTYWNPRAGVDDFHPAFLRWCIESNERCDVIVAVEQEAVVGCVFAHHRDGPTFLDDLCVAGERWSDVGTTLLDGVRRVPSVVCVPAKDHAELAWLATTSFNTGSIFFAFDLRSHEPSARRPTHSAATAARVELGHPPMHVFGAFERDTEGALVVSSGSGLLVGSPPVNPPAFDPGGTTTVIDRVAGSDRATLLASGLAAAAARGDAQAIVVVAATDAELTAIATDLGGHGVVELWAQT